MLRIFNVVVVFCVACFGGVTAALAAQLAGPIFNSTNGHDYYLVSQNTWTGAEAEAATLGGHLATINDATENQWVFDTFSSYGGVDRLLWIGLYDSTGSFGWAWSSGAPVTYSNFSPAEPTDQGNEKWVYMYPNGMPVDPWQRLPGTWNNYWDRNTELNMPMYAVAEVVPEPCTLALLGLGFLSLIYAWRIRNR